MTIIITIKNPTLTPLFASWYAAVPIGGVIKPIIVGVPIIPFFDRTISIPQQADFGSQPFSASWHVDLIDSLTGKVKAVDSSPWAYNP